MDSQRARLCLGVDRPQIQGEIRRLAAFEACAAAGRAPPRNSVVGPQPDDRLCESASEGRCGMIGTVDRARGRWREVLLQFVEARFLTNKHGPCPLCGGKDRYRFDDRNGEGTYYCHQCGAGTGLIMLRKLKNWSHKEACDAVDGIIGTEHRPPAPQAQKKKREPDAAAKL